MLNEAKAGEALCRRKIEIIQQRLGGGSNGEPEEFPPQQGYVDESPMMGGRDLAGTEDYQLKAIAQRQDEQRRESGEDESSSWPPPSMEREQPAGQEVTPTSNGGGQEDVRYLSVQQNGPPVEIQDTEDKAILDEETRAEENPLINEALVDNIAADENEDDISEQDGSSQGEEDLEESFDETNDIIEHGEEVAEIETKKNIQEEEENVASSVAAGHVPRTSVAASLKSTSESPDKNTMNGSGNAAIKSDNVVCKKSPASGMNDSSVAADSRNQRESSPSATATAAAPANNDGDEAKKPSDVIAAGMSTAIVVHSPNNKNDSISSQIWEILRRIVGLSRVAPERSPSYHEAENHPHIMIV